MAMMQGARQGMAAGAPGMQGQGWQGNGPAANMAPAGTSAGGSTPHSQAVSPPPTSGAPLMLLTPPVDATSHKAQAPAHGKGVEVVAASSSASASPSSGVPLEAGNGRPAGNPWNKGAKGKGKDKQVAMQGQAAPKPETAAAPAPAPAPSPPPAKKPATRLSLVPTKAMPARGLSTTAAATGSGGAGSAVPASAPLENAASH